MAFCMDFSFDNINLFNNQIIIEDKVLIKKKIFQLIILLYTKNELIMHDQI